MSPYPQEETCLKLVDAVIDTAAGVDAASLTAARISARAGLPPGEIERCWGSLDELVGAAYSRAARTLHAALAEALAGAGPWLARWEAAVCAALDLMQRRPGIARLVFVESEGRLAAVRERRDLHRRDFVELFASEYGRDGQLGGVPALHVELAAGAAYRAFHDEAVAGHLTDGSAGAVPRLIGAMAMFEPLVA